MMIQERLKRSNLIMLVVPVAVAVAVAGVLLAVGLGGGWSCCWRPSTCRVWG